MGRKVRRTAFVPRAVLGTICAVTVVPAIAQACSSSGSAGYGNTDASPAGRGGTGNRAGSVGVAAGFGGLGVAAGFGGTGGRGGFGGTTATGGTGGFSVAAGFGGTTLTGGSGGSGGFTVAAGFGGTPDSGSDAPDAADAGPTDASGSASLDVNDSSARFGELALVPNLRARSMRGRRRQSGKRRRQRRRA